MVYLDSNFDGTDGILMRIHDIILCE